MAELATAALAPGGAIGPRSADVPSVTAAFLQVIEPAQVEVALAMAALVRGDAKAAEAAYQRVLELRPDFANAHANLGLEYREAGALNDAIADNHRTGPGDRFRVYDRQGERCPRRGCPGMIKRIEQGGRSTYFCPVCQR